MNFEASTDAICPENVTKKTYKSSITAQQSFDLFDYNKIYSNKTYNNVAQIEEEEFEEYMESVKEFERLSEIKVREDFIKNGENQYQRDQLIHYYSYVYEKLYDEKIDRFNEIQDDETIPEIIEHIQDLLQIIEYDLSACKKTINMYNKYYPSYAERAKEKKATKDAVSPTLDDVAQMRQDLIAAGYSIGVIWGKTVPELIDLYNRKMFD
jgi:hypothetical protein